MSRSIDRWTLRYNTCIWMPTWTVRAAACPASTGRSRSSRPSVPRPRRIPVRVVRLLVDRWGQFDNGPSIDQCLQGRGSRPLLVPAFKRGVAVDGVIGRVTHNRSNAPKRPSKSFGHRPMDASPHAPRAESTNQTYPMAAPTLPPETPLACCSCFDLPCAWAGNARSANRLDRDRSTARPVGWH